MDSKCVFSGLQINFLWNFAVKVMIFDEILLKTIFLIFKIFEFLVYILIVEKWQIG